MMRQYKILGNHKIMNNNNQILINNLKKLKERILKYF